MSPKVDSKERGRFRFCSGEEMAKVEEERRSKSRMDEDKDLS